MTRADARSDPTALGAALLCLLIAAPGFAQPLFTSVTREAFGSSPIAGRGTAFGDYDNDGRPDLFLPESFLPQWDSNRIVLWHNEGNGRFAHQGDEIQADFYNSKFKGGGSIWGDYDNDGDLDLFVSVGAWFSPARSPNLLLRNDRGTFHDVALETGLTDVEPSDNAVWLDYDRDGLLDLYVASLGYGIGLGPDGFFLSEEDPNDPLARNRLYRNTGDGTFADVTASVGMDIALHPDAGGSNGGIVAADFNDDGWPDLYVGVFEAPNLLFLSDGQGGFQELSSDAIGDPGEAHNVVSGDINNDGRLDIIMAAGGGGGEFRSAVLLNLGDGQFVDVLDASGLSSLGDANVRGTALVDFDNDGDLDLLTADPHFLFNDGDGIFVDQTAGSGISHRITTAVSVADYDGDGFLDVASSNGPGGQSLYRNNGNDNHWLRIDLVGTESNRSAIGARLVAHTGQLQQTTEISGGTGYEQNDRIAHFGLGDVTTVDRLDIRWPSGQVDVLTDIPADQIIRVIEGRGEWHPARQSTWETPPPESVSQGEHVDLHVVVRPALFEPGATVNSITADLSRLGGPVVNLAPVGDGSFVLDHTLEILTESDVFNLEIICLQETSMGEHWTSLSRQIDVVRPPTAVMEDHNAGSPATFILSQNVPNPFNPETTIRFELPTAGRVELSLHNLSGQRVATLLSGWRASGSYALRWDGTDDAGRALASGTYIYRLTAGSQVESRKLMLLR